MHFGAGQSSIDTRHTKFTYFPLVIEWNFVNRRRQMDLGLEGSKAKQQKLKY